MIVTLMAMTFVSVPFVAVAGRTVAAGLDKFGGFEFKSLRRKIRRIFGRVLEELLVTSLAAEEYLVPTGRRYKHGGIDFLLHDRTVRLVCSSWRVPTRICRGSS